jgi:23S rRNA pseudouridine955/2504/2580 synthase
LDLKAKPKKAVGVRLVSISQDQHGQRLDNYLVGRLKGVPRAAVYRMIRTGQVRINGGRCKPASRLAEGDEVRIPPVHVHEPGKSTVSERICEQIRQAIAYQDGELIVVDKPSGMAVHSGSGLPWGLIDVVRQIFPDQYVELVHRIDRETSGLVVLARSGEALRHMTRQFRDGAVKKHYLCLLNGQLGEALVCVDAPLKEIQVAGEKRITAGDEGKQAKTQFRLLQRFDDCTYVEAELFTGRTHQIRAHAKHLAMPLAGDEKYAAARSLKAWKKRGLKRVFLHAHRLAFLAPGGKRLELSSPLPAQLRKVLEALENPK